MSNQHFCIDHRLRILEHSDLPFLIRGKMSILKYLSCNNFLFLFYFKDTDKSILKHNTKVLLSDIIIKLEINQVILQLYPEITLKAIKWFYLDLAVLCIIDSHEILWNHIANTWLVVEVFQALGKVHYRVYLLK